ncbi:winged helix-turn-helix domain-containing protein [Streptosporangium longisporum]|uniref:ArsR family transcriptional regulator n=1 Tax=Streptosporangium longisporum TaxID=46187 RepID=A0ABP6K9V8_9ACTN
MIRLGFGVRTLSRTRLSISPAMEAAKWLQLAATGRRHPVFGDPGPAARGVLRHPDVALVADLIPPTWGDYMPDLLTPKPRAGSWKEILHTQIAEIEAIGQDDVDTQVLSVAVAHWGRPPSPRVRRLAESGHLQRRLAAGLDRFWHETLHDGWPSLQSVLDNDIAERSKVVAEHGIGRMLDEIHPRVAWNGDTLTIAGRHDAAIDLSDHDVVLAPSVLNRTDLMFQFDDAQVTVYYPAHRVGATGHRGSAELTEVVGTVRAALLGDLGVARSTAELADRHAVAASTISYHLGALHRAGLVTRRRDGRHVLYRRTRRADALTELP